jgi:hypothetical protein
LWKPLARQSESLRGNQKACAAIRKPGPQTDSLRSHFVLGDIDTELLPACRQDPKLIPWVYFQSWDFEFGIADEAMR